MPYNGAARGRAEFWLDESRATLRLAWPLIIAQIAAIALNTTDVVMIGWLGPEPLAGATLAVAALFLAIMFGTGVVSATAPMISQALGARQPRTARRTVRQGLWMSIAISAPIIPLAWFAEPVFLALGQPAAVAAHAGAFLKAAVWMMPGALGFVVLRALLAAHGETAIVLTVTLAGILINAAADYLLIFGNFGAPRLGVVGAGWASAIVHSCMFSLLLLHVTRSRPYRRYALLARFARPDWARFVAIWRLGAPIGLTMTAESGLFAFAALLMGWLGAEALAAHAVALQLAAIAFMTPLGLGHATTARVGLACGRGDARGAAVAGWVSIALACGFMCCTAALFVAAPEPLIGLFLDPSLPSNAASFALAVSYLGIAALFQIVDGAQVAAISALRGMSDTRKPMVLALLCYWAIGLPAAWVLGFPMGLEGIGVWLGLATGLGVAAVVLIWRFHAQTRAQPTLARA